MPRPDKPGAAGGQDKDDGPRNRSRTPKGRGSDGDQDDSRDKPRHQPRQQQPVSGAAVSGAAVSALPQQQQQRQQPPVSGSALPQQQRQQQAAAGGLQQLDIDALLVLNQQCEALDVGAAAAAVQAAAADDAAVVEADNVNTQAQAIMNAIHQRRLDNQAQMQALDPYITETSDMLRNLQTLARGGVSPGIADQGRAAVLNGFVPLIGMLRHAIEASTTRTLRGKSVAELRIDGLTDHNKEQFINCYEDFLFEAILQKINIPSATVTTILNLIWNDNFFRIGASCIGTYFSIVIAADSLILFSNTIIGAITFGHLNARSLTVLCGRAYHNCTWNNFAGLLVYMGVTAENAVEYIRAIQDYSTVQLHYIIMTIYIMVLERYSGYIGIGHDELAALFGAMQIQQAPPPLGNIPDVQQAAAAGAAMQQIVPLQGAQGQSLLVVFSSNIANIAKKTKEVLYAIWNSGIRFTASGILKVFTLFAVAGDPNQSLRHIIIQRFGNFSNFISGITVRRAAALSPDGDPSKRIVMLMLRFIGLDLSQIQDPILILSAFTRNTLAQMRVILENNMLGIGQSFNILTPECLRFLSNFFIINNDGQPMLNSELFQRVTRFVPIVNSNLREEVVGTQVNQPDINDTGGAVVGDDEPLPDPGPATAGSIVESYNHYGEEVGLVFHQSTQGLAVAIRSEGPAANPTTIERLTTFKRLLMVNTYNMVDGFNSYIDQLVISGMVTLADSNTIKQRCIPFIQELQQRIMSDPNDLLILYILGQNPSDRIPLDFITSCKKSVDRVIAAAGVASQAAAAATTSALASWGASLMGLARKTHNSAISNGKRVFAYLLPAPQLQPIQANQERANPAPANVADADAVIQQLEVPEAMPNARPPLQDLPNEIARDLFSQVNQIEPSIPAVQAALGGGGRSRKRSAYKRTRRRKGVAKKQKSKKNKRQSRHKVRRSSSRKVGRK